MFTFTLLSTFLILSHICTIDDGNWDSLKLPATIITAKSIRGHVLYNIELFYENCAQPRRRLLEHSRWIKQAYRSNDYDVPRRYRSQNKLDDNRSYHSPIKNDEDENQDEEEDEEENENDEEENKINETVNDETDEQEENEEEMVNEEPSEIYDYG